MSAQTVCRILLAVAIFASQPAHAEIREYIRDYNYQGETFDSAATCRVNAIDGVKRELLDELGTYVGSVAKQHQDSLGNSYMSQDVIKITAGIVAMKVLNEKWKQPVYYVKAGMKADPDDVLTKLKAMRADLELEKNLRESYEELQRARREMAELKAQLAQLKLAPAAPAVNAIAATSQVFLPKPAPAPVPVVKQMQVMEEQAQKKLVKDLKEEKPLPTVALIVPPEPLPETALKQPQINAKQAQTELDKAVAAEKLLPPPAPAADIAVQVQPPVTAPVVAPAAEILLSSYQRAAQNVEVEEAFQRAMAAKMKGDFGVLLKEMSALADKGYVKAQFRMGWIYERGLGVPQDYQKAREWYEKAMANGGSSAMARMGVLYELGLGVEKNYTKAANYYKEAIRLENGLGYAALGWMYETGKGVQLDKLKAAEYYRQGMERGNYLAMSRLALLYQLGQGGLPRDEKKAAELYMQAIDHGEPLSMTRLSLMYNRGEGGLPIDHARGLALLRESVRYNLPASYAYMGFVYENGWEVKQDYNEAVKWYEKAEKLDAPFGIFRLGMLYKDGLGVSRDRRKAKELIRRAADMGLEQAVRVLDRMNRGG